MAELIGGRYQILKQIGHGGMADVYLAQDTILNREVALKILHDEQNNDPIALERFSREAGAATSLSHPNIVDIYDVGEDHGRHYIVMEYIKGYTLKQYLAKRGTLTVRESVWLMKQIASALLEAHKNGIIHRDVKSQNVLIKADGTVKLSDFGIALARGNIQLTSEDAVVGSVHYLSPECLKGDVATEQSDIYSLGIVFYETLAGDVPFNNEQPIQIAMQHLKDELPSICAIRNDVPQSVENIIIKATAKSPSNRYKKILEMLNDLNECLKPEHKNDKKLIIKNNTFSLKEEKKKEKEVKQKKEIDKKKLFNTLLITCVSLLSILLLILILFVSGVIGTGVKHVVVPDISNMSIVEADDILDKLGLSLDYSNIERVMTENTKEGLIISSVPAIGEEADRGSKVKVIVSDGIYQTMEDLSGKKINDVKEMLKSKNFVVHEQAVEEEGEPGTIVRQEGVLANEKYNPNIQKQITLYYIQYPSILIDFGLLGQDVNNVAAYFKEKGIATEIVELKAEDLTEQEAAYGVNNLVRISPNEGMSYRQVDDQKITLFTYR